MIIIKKFSSLQKAELFAAALRDRGIPVVIHNSYLSGLLPLGDISLAVPESEKERAVSVVNELELNEHREVEEDFREADLSDIYYQKALNSRKKRRINFGLLILLLIIIALLLILTFTNNTSYLLY